AGRLSYSMGLQGPSLAIDTGCSSALVSTHLCSASLRLRECSDACAFGTNFLVQEANLGLHHGGITSSLGRCHTFDQRADGY
ncbi:hypothetical protein AURANDRAFT_17814, partial [Aureococcus anophagefferens]